MNRQQLILTGGIIVLGLLLAFPLTWIFKEQPVASRRQPIRVPESRGTIHQADSNGVNWAITPVGGRYTGADPNAGQAKPAIVVKTDVFRAGGRDVLIGLTLQGRDGQTYQPVIVKNGMRQAAPTLRIVDEAGKVLLDDSFKYG